MKTICNLPGHGEYESERVFEFHNIVIYSRCPVCEKLKIRQLEESQFEGKKRSEIKRRKHMEEQGIESEYFSATIDNYIPHNESQRKAKEACKRLLNGEIKKIVLTGPNGIGKTHLASALAIELDGAVITTSKLNAMISDGYTQGLTAVETLENILLHRFVCLDEVGRTKGSDTELNWLSYLVDKAHVRGIKLMLISNLPLARNVPANKQANCLERFLPNDVISRLCQYSEFVEMEGDDYRRR